MSKLNIMDLSLEEIIKDILKGCSVLKNNEEDICDFRDAILDTYNLNKKEGIKSKILVAGAGRSGLVARAFAMRLMHLGYLAYAYGDTIVPPLENGDVVIVISKSGKSNSIIQTIEESKMNDIKILAVSGDDDCEIVKIADAKIIIKERAGYIWSKRLDELDFDYEWLSLMGTGFEISAMVLLDALVVELMQSLKLTEDDLISRHDVLSSHI